MAEVSRRAVLGMGAGSVVLLTLGGREAGATVSAGNSMPLRSHYAGSVGAVFTADRSGVAARLTLAEIQDLVPTTAALRPHCFTMIFEPVGNARLDDGIYALRRAGVEPHILFLSSVGSAGAMQAIINRPV